MYKECVKCVMDTSDPDIVFNDHGVCNHCVHYENHLNMMGSLDQRKSALTAMIAGLKERGRGKKYDCIMGLSGGVDSSYLTYLAVKEYQLRPLVVHVDTGWNSELAVNNIQNIVQRLNLDLHTLVIDWEEIRDIQRAYFLSGIANLDVPQDHAFIASLYKEARKFGIMDVLNGGNMQTESILPAAWGYDASDLGSLRAIHRKFGTRSIKKFPTINVFERLIYLPYVLRMRVHRPLELIDFNKNVAKSLLMSELGWRDYGGKHYESVFTKFHQAHYLPTKFGYDKRRAHLSSLIVSAQMTREEAKEELKQPLYSEKTLEVELQYWLKKLGIDASQYAKVMTEKPVYYTDFPNDQSAVSRIKSVMKSLAEIKRSIKALAGR